MSFGNSQFACKNSLSSCTQEAAQRCLPDQSLEFGAILTEAVHCAVLGLTKMVSRLGKEGCWRKALEIYQSLPQTGVRPDTAITNAAISACDKGMLLPSSKKTELLL